MFKFIVVGLLILQFIHNLWLEDKLNELLKNTVVFKKDDE